MGKFSYKKRKGTRKQSFKNRKRVKKGGDNHQENPVQEEAPTPTTTTTDAVNTADNANQNAAVVDQNKAENTQEEVTEVNKNAAAAATTTTENTQEELTGVDPNAAGQKEANNAEANDAAENEEAQQDWKEGQSAEAVQQAEQEVSDIEKKAENNDGELDPEEINNLVNQLAEGKDVPLWAKALAKSGAAGTAAKILNKNPKLRDALMAKGIDVINNADVSMAPGSASAPGAPNAGTGAPGANTSTAAPGGSYTADDAGYQKFIEAVKTNPETLKNVVYVLSLIHI